jgi:heme oxygenase
MSLKLKELTWAHHQAAERRAFAKELLSGKIDPALYHTFLWCQYMNYNVLEELAIIPPNLNKIHRSRRIFQDIRELEQVHGFEPPNEYPASVAKYAAHLYALGDADNNQAPLW